jgi:hypothetical protein
MNISSLLSIVFMCSIFLTACGSSSEEATKQKLNENTVTLTPPPGIYDHGVVVAFSKAENGTGSGALEFKDKNGNWSISLENCYGGVEKSNTCINVNESMEITYRLSTFSGESDEKTVSYIINPTRNDVVVNDVKFSEDKTICSINSDNELRFFIRAKNENTLPNKYISVIGQVIDLTILNTSLVITNDDAGIAVESTGSDSPSYPDYYPGANSFSREESCRVSLTEFKVGQRVAGTIFCAISVSRFDDHQDLGPTAVLEESTWVCDEWSD